LAIANTLTKGGGPTKAFPLSNLLKLGDLKSPVMKGISLLHCLVDMLIKKKPKILDWINQLPAQFEEAYRALAYFQSAFPTLLEQLWRLEKEIHYVVDTDSVLYKNLSKFKDQLKKAVHNLSKQLQDIDDKIAFFGEFNPEIQNDETVGALTNYWNGITEKKIIPKSIAAVRLKQDISRYSFYKILHTFFGDVKTAHTFLKNTKGTKLTDLNAPEKKLPQINIPMEQSGGLLGAPSKAFTRRRMRDKAPIEVIRETSADRKSESLANSMGDGATLLRTVTKAHRTVTKQRVLSIRKNNKVN